MDSVAKPDDHSRRNRSLIILTAVLLLIALLYSFYWFFYGRFYEETDNAYVNGNVVPITAQVAGTVIAINVEDTQYVKQGQQLVELDRIDTFVALEQAKANLAKTLRATQQLFINNNGLEANVLVRKAELAKARVDLNRRAQAIRTGAISKEELTHAQDTYNGALASLAQAQSSLDANRALTTNTQVIKHPDVLQAAAILRRAYLDYVRSTIRSPIAGYVSKRSVQIGERIEAGAQLMAIVPLDQVWVDANFKEKQLRNMRIGQPVTLYADIYGSAVPYHGNIAGFSAGTGSAFALLPAQNATGNWIKVVQRLPVRIALQARELALHPLRIGLSMQVIVDMHDNKGKPLNEIPILPTYSTPIYNDVGKEIDTVINKIIAENVSATNNAHISELPPIHELPVSNNNE